MWAAGVNGQAVKLDTPLSERGEIFIAPLPSPVRHTHTSGPRLDLSDGIPHRLQPDIVHNRNTGARSVGVKPCCSAPVLPAEGWLSAVANEGLMPCNYSNEARLAALESRGKCGHSCNRRCQAGKEIVLFKRSGKKCFIGQGGGGRVLNTHR